MKKRKFILFIAFISFLTGCNVQKTTSIDEREYAVIKSSMNYSDKTEITYFDSKMNVVDTKKYKYGNVGECQFRYPIVKNNILYEISLGYGEEKDNCKILAINLKTDEVKEYNSKRVNITSFYVDDKYIYAISNLNRITYIDRYLIDGDEIQSIVLKNTNAVDMFVCNEKVYFYKEINGKYVLNRIDFFTKRAEGILSDKIKFEEETSHSVIYNNQIYIPYGKDIVVISPDSLKYKVIKMPKTGNEVSGLYRDDDNLYVLQADAFGNDNNSTIINYDLKTDKSIYKYAIPSSIMQFAVKKNNLYVLSLEEDLIKYSIKSDGQIKELVRAKLDGKGYQFVSAGFICDITSNK